MLLHLLSNQSTTTLARRAAAMIIASTKLKLNNFVFSHNFEDFWELT
jgi:hypothetical protein